jgi:WXG100 family type VII secretion target
MGQPTYSYKPEDLYEAMQAMTYTNGLVSDHLDKLEKSAEAQLSTWTGADQDAYWTHKTEWRKAMTQMNNILTENAAPAVGNCLDAYHQNEMAGQRRWLASGG